MRTLMIWLRKERQLFLNMKNSLTRSRLFAASILKDMIWN